MSPEEMAKEMIRLSRMIDAGLDTLREQTQELAKAEATYRKAKAQAWVEVSVKEDMLANHRQAWVDAQTAELRQKRDIHAGLEKAAIEGNRSRRSQLSALQSLLNAHRAEAEFSQTQPREYA